MSSIDWIVCDVESKPDIFINVIRNRIYFCKYLRDKALYDDLRFIRFCVSDNLFGFKFLKSSDTNSLALILNSKEVMICYSTYICNMIPNGKHQVFYDSLSGVYYIKLS